MYWTVSWYLLLAPDKVLGDTPNFLTMVHLDLPSQRSCMTWGTSMACRFHLLLPRVVRYLERNGEWYRMAKLMKTIPLWGCFANYLPRSQVLLIPFWTTVWWSFYCTVMILGMNLLFLAVTFHFFFFYVQWSTTIVVYSVAQDSYGISMACCCLSNPQHIYGPGLALITQG